MQLHELVLVLIITVALLSSLSLVRRKVTGTLYQPIRKHLIFKGFLYKDIYISVRSGKWSLGRKKYKGSNINVWLFDGWKDQPVLLYFHGNSQNISYREYMIRLCQLMKINILLVDYRGYGRSDSKASCRNILRDAKISMEFLLKHYPEEKIYVWGESLGGTPASYIASKYSNISGIILFSTFASFHQLMENADTMKKYLTYNLARIVSNDIDYYTNNIGMISHVSKAPIMILHSKEDTLIPYSNARRLYNAIPHENKQLLTIYGDHIEPEVTISHIKSITEFIGLKVEHKTLKEMQKVINELVIPTE